MRFDPLPASAREADTIVRIWKQSQTEGGELRLTGHAATEAAVKQRAARTRVLHLATHGFFLGGRCASALPQAGREPRSGRVELDGPCRKPAPSFRVRAHRCESATGAAADAEDGILDRRGSRGARPARCRMGGAVGMRYGRGGSPCGRGRVRVAPRVPIAGARTVIVSLWPVGDDDTRRWMTSVYEARFARTIATMDAAREATLEQLRRRRQAALSTHPFYWGGFIAAGDWR